MTPDVAANRPLPPGWRFRTIGELAQKVGSGATPRGGAAVYVPDGVALIRSQNIHDHEFRKDGLVYLAPEAALTLKNVTVQPGDVLLNITGDSILRVCVAPEDVLPARVNQHVAIIRVDSSETDSRFLQKWLSLPEMKTYMLNHSSGGTRKAVTKAHILSFPVPQPPRPEQEAIADTLSSLDDAIASRKRAIDLAERLGQAILVRSLALVHGEPRWSNLPLADYIVKLETGSRPKGGATEDDDGIPSLGAENIQSAGISKALKFKVVPAAYVEQMKRGRLTNGDVLVYKDGGTPGNFVPHVSAYGYGFPTANAVINEHVYRVRAAAPISQALLYWVLRSSWLTREMRKRGTGAAIPGLNSKSFRDLPFPELSQAAVVSLNGTLEPLLEKILRLGAECSRLSQLRDKLLPDLLTGQWRVAEITAAQMEDKSHGWL